MPDHVKFLLRHALIGVAVGLAVVVALTLADVAHLRTLISKSPQRWLWMFILCASFSFTFGGLQMAMAVMLMPREDPDDDDWRP